jgi:hypothetical protein
LPAKVSCWYIVERVSVSWGPWQKLFQKEVALFLK